MFDFCIGEGTVDEVYGDDLTLVVACDLGIAIL